MEDQLPSANNTRDTECTRIPITEDEGEDHHQYFDGRRIHTVPQHMRFNKHHVPKMVSFGPYYNGLPELFMAEDLKCKVLTDFVSSSGKDREFFYRQIFKVIDQIRNCYVGVSRWEYDDEALAEMMLRDAYFAIYLMESNLGDMGKNFHIRHHLGMAASTLVNQDMYLLDNQIPLWVIKLLGKLIYEEEEEVSILIYLFLSSFVFANSRIITRISGEDKRQPLHLLDAVHRLHVEELDNVEKTLVQPLNKRQSWLQRQKNRNEYEFDNRQSHSVTDLKAKGIHFKPSTHCLKNIKFKSFMFHGQLQLPVLFFSPLTQVLFAHMIAYEAFPESETHIVTLCYVNFLKSLVVKPEDVRELREKKILFSNFDSDEQIVKAIKEIDNYGLGQDYIFHDVKMRIEKHCSSKAKTWIAELIHTYFRNPWTFIALVAATILLGLTFLQTYYTMNLPK